MLLFRLASTFLVAGVHVFVAADDPPPFAPPSVLASEGDSDTTLQPLTGNPVRTDDAVDDTKVIRGLLKRYIKRQSCPGGYGLCNSGGCCPIGGQCCGGNRCCPAGQWCYSTGCCDINENGCANVSCCPFGTNCCAGGGCCQAGYYCDVVNGQKGCCQNGKVCTSGPGGGNGCATTGYVPCSGDSFCCPSGYTCYRDSANNPQCSYGSPNTYSYTYSDTYSYTSTSTSTRVVNTATYSYSNGDGSNGPNQVSNFTSSRSSSIPTLHISSTSPSTDSTGVPNGQLSGAADWRRGSLRFCSGVAPVLVLIGAFL